MVFNRKAPLGRGFGLSGLAEKEGFEPPVQSPGQRFSRPPHSTTLPFLRRKYSIFFIFDSSDFFCQVRTYIKLYGM